MNISLEKQRIILELRDVQEEWLIEAIQKLLGIFNEEEVLAERYRSQFRPMSREELMQRALLAEADIREGRGTDAVELLHEA